MSDHPPIAPQEGSGVEPAANIPQEPHVFTEEELGEYREQDRFLPIANVARIMKNALPTNAKIAKDAKETVQECVSEFISFITSEAAEKCHLEKRKTVVGEDIIYALYSLGFENYAETLKVHLARMRHAHSMHSSKGRTELPEGYMEEDPQGHDGFDEGLDDAGQDADAQGDDDDDDVDLDERFAEVVQKGTFEENGDET